MKTYQIPSFVEKVFALDQPTNEQEYKIIHFTIVFVYFQPITFSSKKECMLIRNLKDISLK